MSITTAPTPQLKQPAPNDVTLGAHRQPSTSEVAPTPPAAQTDDEKLSPKYLALARREKMLLKRDQELKERETKLASKEAEYQTSYVPKAKLKERAMTDPLGVLSDLEVTPDQFTQALLNQRPEDVVYQKLMSRIELLESKLSETATNAETQKKQEYEQAVNQIRRDVKLSIDGSEEFETIKAMGAEEAVVRLIEETFKTQKIVLDIREACEEVESHLVDEAMKMTSLKKVQSRLNPSPEAAPQQPSPKQQPQQIKTLTNAGTAAPSKPLTNKERREKAILAFQGKL
jgi:hypothetical protein